VLLIALRSPALASQIGCERAASGLVLRSGRARDEFPGKRSRANRRRNVQVAECNPVGLSQRLANRDLTRDITDAEGTALICICH
jgi:hypothetical protein